ncbi:hypothetical protein MA16_Dca020906 [Dendrobium catenatum]|uniref:Uncharacterized protein n=1 Tax=Dendrobium catenatum TaxID=906689 RepID=A0A2I0VN48_9ASPA|nr:hypothetical protein MA16_Dca020906 [Dendrobium catenatum]
MRPSPPLDFPLLRGFQEEPRPSALGLSRSELEKAEPFSGLPSFRKEETPAPLSHPISLPGPNPTLALAIPTPALVKPKLLSG